MDDQDWGPWIEHDGKGCPCPGEYMAAIVEWEPGDTRYVEGIAEAGALSWDWSYHLTKPKTGFGLLSRVIRYRIRKPKGMKLVEKALNVRIPGDVDA